MISYRSSLSSAAALAVGALAACSRDATFTEPTPSLAAIHWVNAVPDTNKMAFRLVDIVSNASLFGVTFRSANVFYKGIETGPRHIRVFFDTTDVVLAQTVFSDTSYTFTQDQSYTFIEAGFARGNPPARAVWIVADGAADPGAGNVGFRVIHAGAGLGAVDVNLTRHPTDTLPDAPLAANVTYGATGSYVALPADVAATDSLRVVVTAAGTKTPALFAAVKLPPGEAGDATKNPIAGARVEHSVMTAILVPASVVGSPAPQGGAFAAPSVVILVDRRPPNTVQ